MPVMTIALTMRLIYYFDSFGLDWTSCIVVFSFGSFIVALWYIAREPQQLSFPVYNKGKGKNFGKNAAKLVAKGFKKYPKAFVLETDTEPTLILSPEYADEIRNDDRLDHARVSYTEYFGRFPGFDVFDQHLKHTDKSHEIVRIKLTRGLTKITSDLNEEAALTLQDFWTDSRDWHEIVLRESMADIVARLSARVFLGKELCRDPEWLRITVEYANNVAAAAAAIRKYPKVLRPVVHWFIPEAKTLRQQLAAASRIIQREVDKRESADWKSHDGGTFADAIQWTNEVYGAVKPDHTLVQMGLAFASLHTTADFLTQVIYDLCKHRKLMKRLRKEVILVVKEAGGLDRNAISKLKLMDSVLKESQRLKPSSILMMRRVATSNIVLKDGLFIPKGTSLGIPTIWHRHEAHYDRPNKFDGYRFFRMARREPAKANQVHLISTGPSHLGFGHGKIACPGRFFAAEMSKLTLAHVLLKYDFKMANPNEDTSPVSMKWLYLARSGVKILVRRRAKKAPL